SIRATAARISRPSWSTAALTQVTRRMEGIGGRPRYFSDSVRTGSVLSEEERAAENVYIQKI
ncbi:hypothetical protein, partial [Klebsiella pneumoniae]|uniref:hypothetical protein n=1 Tax=Klebsiella pneumoniae TaxID=573 RepID=UPI003013A1E1